MTGVCDPASVLEEWDVRVAQQADGEVVIWHRTRMSDGSGGDGRGWGPCPRPEQPLRGPGSFEPGVGVVHTVASNVDKVSLRLSDGSEHWAELQGVEASDAQWFSVKILDPAIRPATLTAFGADGAEIGRMDL